MTSLDLGLSYLEDAKEALKKAEFVLKLTEKILSLSK